MKGVEAERDRKRQKNKGLAAKMKKLGEERKKRKEESKKVGEDRPTVTQQLICRNRPIRLAKLLPLSSLR